MTRPPTRPGVAMGSHCKDEQVLDRDMLDEIDLLTEVIIAVQLRDRHLAPAEIDAALGVVMQRDARGDVPRQRSIGHD